MNDVCEGDRVTERGGDGTCLFSLECTGDSCTGSAPSCAVESTGEATEEEIATEGGGLWSREGSRWVALSISRLKKGYEWEKIRFKC